jgi:hypothetical protein
MIGMFLALLELVRQRRIVLRAPGARATPAADKPVDAHSGHIDDVMEIELALTPPELRAADPDAEGGTALHIATLSVSSSGTPLVPSPGTPGEG